MSDYCQSHSFLLWLTSLTIWMSFVSADIMVISAIAKHQIEAQFSDVPARFGRPIPTDGIKGMVVYSKPDHACEAIAKPPVVKNYNGAWIVLIARYNCSFEDKVRRAQESGYDAVIVHNVNSNELEPMSAKDPTDDLIPSVFVSEITGLLLRENYLYKANYFVLINDDMPFNINTHLLLPFAIVVGICFLIMVIFMVVRCIKDRRRQRRHRLPNSSLKKIPTHKYTKGDPYETCAICLDDYIEGEKLRVLPCAHAYHAKCIDPWLTKNKRVCPVCKRKVFAANERVISDSESDSDADDSTPLIRDGHQGTQGGTFTQQRENPFSRALRNQERHESNASSGSEEHNYTQNVFPEILLERRESDASSGSAESYRSLVTSGESRSPHIGETSGTTSFLVSDSLSINGESHDFEHSTSSTRPHTVTLRSVGVEEQPATVVHVTSQSSRHPVGTSDPDLRNGCSV